MATAIPPITDPLGRHWTQPATDGVLVDDELALMDHRAFCRLSEYSTSIPSGKLPADEHGVLRISMATIYLTHQKGKR
jgi:hypothetical protein